MKSNVIIKYSNPVRTFTKLSIKLLRGEKNIYTGKWLKNELVKLGPTYVKIGQLVSSREDIFPNYITTPLKSLQDNVPSFSIDDVQEIFKSETGHDINDVFHSFSTTPIASASISQVHSAVLKCSNIKVAVKIQRPNIQETFEYDLIFLKNTIKFLSVFGNNKNLNDMLLIINECTQGIEKEINFINEMNNIYI